MELITGEGGAGRKRKSVEGKLDWYLPDQYPGGPVETAADSLQIHAACVAARE